MVSSEAASGSLALTCGDDSQRRWWLGQHETWASWTVGRNATRGFSALTCGGYRGRGRQFEQLTGTSDECRGWPAAKPPAAPWPVACGLWRRGRVVPAACEHMCVWVVWAVNAGGADGADGAHNLACPQSGLGSHPPSLLPPLSPGGADRPCCVCGRCSRCSRRRQAARARACASRSPGAAAAGG